MLHILLDDQHEDLLHSDMETYPKYRILAFHLILVSYIHQTSSTFFAISQQAFSYLSSSSLHKRINNSDIFFIFYSSKCKFFLTLYLFSPQIKLHSHYLLYHNQKTDENYRQNFYRSFSNDYLYLRDLCSQIL